MVWCWDLAKWPQFSYEKSPIAQWEQEFLLKVGGAGAYLKVIGDEERSRFLVEILSLEGVESARIEGERLDRESLQSSIRRQFDLQTAKTSGGEKEAHMAKLLWDVYASFDQPLSHEMLQRWHAILFHGSPSLGSIGTYRVHAEPMQIVSNRYGDPHVFYEAPPSRKVGGEMEAFVRWFNAPSDGMLILEKAALAHLYFEMIHPLEDGNGRLGRALAEKVLSQKIGKPILIAISRELERNKKQYYAALEACNRTLQVQAWMEFFARTVVEACEHSMELLTFLVEKSKFFARFSSQLNERQTKALLRMFTEGPDGFQGGMSAEKYIAITKTTRATATRDLSDLVKKGALTKTSALRHTRYHLPLR